MILNIISQISAKGAIGYVVEYCGTALEDLSTEARFTLCNMTVEAGARGALIAPDKTAIDYVLARCPDITGEIKEQALAHWATLYSDKDAKFEKEYEFDASNMAPFVTWGTSPDQAIAINASIPTMDSIADPVERLSLEQALKYTKLSDGQSLEGTPINHVFIGSCTNGRIEDLRNVIATIGNRKVAKGVRAMVVPGSGAVKAQAEQEGIADKLIAAGFEWRKPGCSMCLAMNDDVLTSGTRCASTTNRNFEGRQGRGAITHLMSPAMAAAAAVTGKITDVRKLQGADNG
jgi:3-isopropylmalate/(R)-2-methylmalate dehydratase large subunit